MARKLPFQATREGGFAPLFCFLRRAIWLPALLTTLLLTGCDTLSFYRQAVGGQLEILSRRQSVARLLASPDTPPDTRQWLQDAQSIRNYASATLGLPDNGSYRSYADLHRPYVVWNVIATPDDSLTPYVDCFPIAGCVPYRGFFSAEDAKAFAAKRRKDGADVFSYGVPVYSTLGWFDDPLLNTLRRMSRPELARLIFHELAHQVVYVPGDADFNESYATAVELEGVKRWLAEQGTGEERAGYRESDAQQDEFLSLMRSTRDELASAYAAEPDHHARLVAKARILANLSQRYEAWKSAHNGYTGYDHWFKPLPGNAHFAILATYDRWVPDFRRMWQICGEPSRFYRWAKYLAKQANRADLLKSATRCEVG